jgi:anti-sigma regulatory factor (Ser/Thr protein kinase)
LSGEAWEGGVCGTRCLGYRIYVFAQIDLRLRPDANSPAEARRSLEALRPRLDDLLLDDAVLLVSEIVSNSVRHASLDETDAIEVRIRGSRSKLRVDVVDPGPGFDPERTRSSEREGGWGLRLLDRLATRWGVERNDGTRVWFELTSPVSADSSSGT